MLRRGAFAVEYLGMPDDAMPFYEESDRWKKKALRVRDFILMSGNMGHNRESYFGRYPYLIRKVCSMGRRLGDGANHLMIIPVDSLRFLPSLVFHGVRDAMRRE